MTKVVDLFLADVVEFDQAIAIACMKKSAERFECKVPPVLSNDESATPRYFYRRDNCLVLSFDHSWYPFLDSTHSYNYPSVRWYVPKISHLLGIVANEMQTPEHRRLSGQPGGRVFLHNAGAIRRLGSREIEFVRWQLPKPSLLLQDRLVPSLLPPASPV